MTPTTDARAFHIRVARVHLSECRARRNSRVNRDFYWRLFAWAQHSRQLAAGVQAEPVQGGLFA